jgi:hypothetical protein
VISLEEVAFLFMQHLEVSPLFLFFKLVYHLIILSHMHIPATLLSFGEVCKFHANAPNSINKIASLSAPVSVFFLPPHFINMKVNSGSRLFSLSLVSSLSPSLSAGHTTKASIDFLPNHNKFALAPHNGRVHTYTHQFDTNRRFCPLIIVIYLGNCGPQNFSTRNMCGCDFRVG